MRQRLRRIVLPVAALGLVATLAACDNQTPELSISLVVRNNGDGTTTVRGTAYDVDDVTKALNVKVSVGDVVLATTTAGEDSPGLQGRRFKGGMACSKGGPTWLCPEPYERIDVGTKHGFSAVIPTPADSDAPVCVWVEGVGEKAEDKVEFHATKCATARDPEKLVTGSTTTSTTAPTGTPTTTEATTTTVAPTTTAAPTTTTSTTTSTTTTTMLAPPTSMPGGGGPCGPDPMDFSCI